MWKFGTTVKLGEKEHFDKEQISDQKVPCKFDCAIKAFISATKVVLGRWLLRTQKSELVSRVNFDRNISPNSKGRSPIFLLGWPALGDCSICDIIPSNLSSGSFFIYLSGRQLYLKLGVTPGLVHHPKWFSEKPIIKNYQKMSIIYFWELPTFKSNSVKEWVLSS